jgi:peptidoglycan/LPS O-acetylase OafA/YrhL
VIVVFAAHAGLPVILSGSTGVTIFFFLSGFLITSNIYREIATQGVLRIRRFYWRRYVRLLPPAFAALALVAVAHIVWELPGQTTRSATIAQIFQATNYWIITRGREDLYPSTLPFWSLSVEEHFYLVYPILVVGLARIGTPIFRVRYVFAGLILAALAWRLTLVFAFGAGFDRIYLGSDTRSDSLLAGCLLALSLSRIRYWVGLLRAHHSAGAFLCLIVFWRLQALSGNFGLTVGLSLQLLPLAFLFGYLILYPRSAAATVLGSNSFVWLGSISYSFYLIHQLSIDICRHIFSTWGRWPISILSLATTLALAMLLSAAVERPAIRAKSLSLGNQGTGGSQ